MIYDDQPQMVEAARVVLAGRRPDALADAALVEAFAAIDREALIEKASAAYSAVPNEADKALVEGVLVMAGILTPGNNQEQRGDG